MWNHDRTRRRFYNVGGVIVVVICLWTSLCCSKKIEKRRVYEKSAGHHGGGGDLNPDSIENMPATDVITTPADVHPSIHSFETTDIEEGTTTETTHHLSEEGRSEQASAWQTKALTPLYVYPDTRKGKKSVYKRVASSTIPQFVILNPNNGKDARRRPNSAWTKAIRTLRSAESNVEKMLGYVHIQWLNGRRGLDDIKRNIDQYARNKWSVDGIFFDESPASTEEIEDLRDLSAHVKAVLGDDALVVLNPGTHVPDAYFEFADVVVVFEDFYTQWDMFNLDRYAETVQNDPERPFAVIVRDVPEELVSETYESAIRRGAGYVFLGLQGAQFHSPGCFFFETLEGPSACPL